MDLNTLSEAILKGDAKSAVAITNEALAAQVDPQRLVNEHMIPAMDEVGRRFEADEIFVPELLVTARAMKAALEVLKPVLAARGCKPVGKVVVGTVKGDQHDIGKNLVASMLEGAGFEVIDLGVDASPEKFLAAVETHNPQIVAMSALLTTTMIAMRATIEQLVKAGKRSVVKVIVGGAPVNINYAREIGADGYSENANGAVQLARKLVGAN